MVAEKKGIIGFKEGDFVVYPTHGVGQVKGIEKETISGQRICQILNGKKFMTDTIN